MAENTADKITLADIHIGSCATVSGFTERAMSRRFVEMGFVRGAEVLAVRRAPLGDPTEYAVMGGRVAMRRIDAEKILVEAAL